MKLCGEVLKHKFFGRGQIIAFENDYITVLFEKSKEEKKFAYPTAFGTFLELENTSFLKEIEQDKNALAQKKAEIERLNEERALLEIEKISMENAGKHVKKPTVKSTDKNNIAFKCNYCDGGSSSENVGYKGVCSDDTMKFNINVAKHIWCRQPENKCYKYLHGEISREELCKFYEETKSQFSKSVCYESQMLEIWNAGAGVTQNGDKKGTQMSLRNAKPNSLAVLTTKLPFSQDKDRFIFAVFLIDEKREGDKKDDGHVGANAKYRIELSPEEAKGLMFWDYYFNPKMPEKTLLGSGLHRYLTDIQSAQILKKICEIKEGTPLGRIFGNGPDFTGKAYGVTRIPTVKGQTMPAYDPRAVKGMGVTYATSTMGADHTAGYAVTANILKVGGYVDPLKKEGQVELSKNLQIGTAAIDSTGLCLFVAFAFLDYEDVANAVIDMINAQYGVEWTSEDWINLGKYVLKTERTFNEAAGFTKNDDRLPEFTEEPLPPHNAVWDITGEELDKVLRF